MNRAVTWCLTCDGVGTVGKSGLLNKPYYKIVKFIYFFNFRTETERFYRVFASETESCARQREGEREQGQKRVQLASV